MALQSHGFVSGDPDFGPLAAKTAGRVRSAVKPYLGVFGRCNDISVCLVGVTISRCVW